jgi:hypothetical protein
VLTTAVSSGLLSKEDAQLAARRLVGLSDE